MVAGSLCIPFFPMNIRQLDTARACVMVYSSNMVHGDGQAGSSLAPGNQSMFVGVATATGAFRGILGIKRFWVLVDFSFDASFFLYLFFDYVMMGGLSSLSILFVMEG